MNSNPRPWYETAFDAAYLERYKHRTGDEAQRAVELFQRWVSLRPSDSVFDLCCGAGRHLEVMVESGIRASGGDLSTALLHVARSKGLDVVRLDMRRIPLSDSSCAAVTNFFTAFGYFDSDAENFLVWDEVSRILKPGGYFLFDFLNAPVAIASVLANAFEVIPRDGSNPGGDHWRVRRWISDDGKFAHKLMESGTAEEPDESVDERVRLYTRSELEAALQSRGFTVERVAGNYEGDSWREATSPRLILLARKCC